MKKEQREIIDRRLDALAKEIDAIRTEASRDWHPPEECVSVILANLSDAEFDALQAARIHYSGSTGKGAIAGYEPYGPYIATFAFELPKALSALAWEHMSLTRAGNQLIVRRDRRAHQKP